MVLRSRLVTPRAAFGCRGIGDDLPCPLLVLPARLAIGDVEVLDQVQQTRALLELHHPLPALRSR